MQEKPKIIVTTDICSLCLEPLCHEGHDIALLSCNHTFHKNCLMDTRFSRVEGISNCPMCRKEFKNYLDSPLRPILSPRHQNVTHRRPSRRPLRRQLTDQQPVSPTVSPLNQQVTRRSWRFSLPRHSVNLRRRKVLSRADLRQLYKSSQHLFVKKNRRKSRRKSNGKYKH